MIHDLLLSYLSEKGSGKFDDLRDTWDWLGERDNDPAHRAWIVASDLSALGHIEISWAEDGPSTWCAAPPIVTMLPRSGGHALITGARTRKLYEPARDGVQGRPAVDSRGALLEVADELNLYVAELRGGYGLTTALVACETHRDAERLANGLGITYTYSVASQLSSLLPPLSAYEKLWDSGELPLGFEAEYFDTRTLDWIDASSTEQLGLYRARTWERYIHVLHGPSEGQWRRANREHAIFEVLRWEVQDVISYDHTTNQLTVPWHVGLPVLPNRAAVLSSGKLPEYKTSVKPAVGEVALAAYANVEFEVAEKISSSLNQNLLNIKT